MGRPHSVYLWLYYGPPAKFLRHDLEFGQGLDGTFLIAGATSLPAAVTDHPPKIPGDIPLSNLNSSCDAKLGRPKLANFLRAVFEMKYPTRTASFESVKMIHL